MAIIKTEKSGRILYRVFVKDLEGGFFPRKYFDKKADAQDYEAGCIRKKNKGERGTVTQVRGKSVSDYWNTNWSARCRTKVSKGWRTSQDQMFKDHIEPVIGSRPLLEVSKSDILDVFVSAESKGLGAQTQLHIYNLLHRVFEDSIQIFEYRESNPVLKHMKPSVPKIERKFLKAEEALRFLEFVLHKESVIAPAIWIMIYSGIRIGEMQGLRWGDLDFQAGRLHLKRQWNRKVNEFTPVKAKRETAVPLAEPLIAYLKQVKPVGALASDLVLSPLKSCRVFNHNVFWRRLKKLSLAFGLTNHISPHELRHTCSMLWKSVGASLSDRKQLLNQASEDSAKRYDHDVDDRLVELSRKLGGVKPGPQPEPETRKRVHLRVIQ